MHCCSELPYSRSIRTHPGEFSIVAGVVRRCDRRQSTPVPNGVNIGERLLPKTNQATRECAPLYGRNGTPWLLLVVEAPPTFLKLFRFSYR